MTVAPTTLSNYQEFQVKTNLAILLKKKLQLVGILVLFQKALITCTRCTDEIDRNCREIIIKLGSKFYTNQS